jgi:thiamine biosynthesis lipoprotein
VDEISAVLRTWKTELWLAARINDSAATRRWLGDVLRTEVAALDALASRFRADSELSAVNRGAGHWVQVSWEFVAVLTASLEAASATDGLVNPLLGGHVVAAGYDVWAAQDSGIVAAAGDSDWQAIEIQPGRPAARVRIPSGTALDLGAVAKGWLADRLAKIVYTSTGADCVANMGGDLRVISPARPWVVAADAEHDETAMELEDAGLATSGTGHRAWAGGHHIIGAACPHPVGQRFGSGGHGRRREHRLHSVHGARRRRTTMAGRDGPRRLVRRSASRATRGPLVTIARRRHGAGIGLGAWCTSW